MKKTLLSLLLLSTFSTIWAQTPISIADARSQDLNTTVTVKGIILNGGELGRTRYLQDETAAIGIFQPDLADLATTGDSLLVTGQLSEFNNLLQITNEEDNFEFTILNRNNPLPAPKTLSISEGFREAYESQLVQFEQVTFEETGNFSGNTNYTITDGNNAAALRVDNDTNIAGAEIPTTATTAIGIMGQFQETYQLLPRSLDDLGLTAPVVELTDIATARSQGIDATVKVQGIVLNGDELGNTRYLQDNTAGIAIFNPDLADEVQAGDEIIITGQLSAFNELLQITDGGNFEYTIVSSGNDLPAPKTLNIADAFNDTYEGQLVRFNAVSFVEMGTFEGNTNYNITDGANTGLLRVDDDTNIDGQPIPTEAIDAVGIMSRFREDYQLLPRSVDDLGLEEMMVGSDNISIAEARTRTLGATVTIKGIVTTSGELGRIRYMQDATAGIGIFDFDLSNEVVAGDSLLVTGQIADFNGLLQITSDGGAFNYTILNSGNDLPEPKVLSLTEGFSETYEGQLVRFNAINFTATNMAFLGNTNYDITDGNTTAQLRVDDDTDISGTPIPSETTDVIGIMGQFQETYQLLPRSAMDLGLEPVDNTGLISIAEARQLVLGSTVTIKGIVTNGDELGSIRFMQDGTSGVGVFNPDLAMEVERGDSLLVTGQLSSFNDLLEVTDEGAGFEYTVLSKNNPVPPAIDDLSPAFGFSEDYEGQLIQFNNVTFISEGNFANGDQNYRISDGFLTYEIRVNGNSNIAGTPIPAGPINVRGIMGQFRATYQLLPRDLNDFLYDGNPPILTSVLTQSNIQTSGFTVNFTTLNEGNTTIKYGLTKDLELGEFSDDNLTTNHSLDLTGLAPGTIYYVQATTVSSTGDQSISAVQPMATVSLSSGDIKVYFNSPVDHSVSTGQNAIYVQNALADTAIAYMQRAKESIDICLYTFDNANGLVDALIDADNRGIQVRVVVEEEESNPALINVLPGEVTLRPTDVDGIMHNKFILIDTDSDDPNAPIVWTGSTNFSDGQLNRDPNEVIIIQDQSLARGYQLEFEELLGGRFGSNKRELKPSEYIVGGKRVEAYFSPSQDVRTELFRTIETADSELYTANLIITRNNIAFALLDEAAEGVYVAGITDDDGNPFGEDDDDYPYQILVDGLPAGQYFSDEMSYIFHYKYMIVDAHDLGSDPLVWTGSYNWTNSAQFRNDENVVVVHDATIANLYYQSFAYNFKNLGGTLLFTNIEEHQTPFQLSVYPNPAHDFIAVDFAAEQPTAIAINIVNITGQTVYTKTISQVQQDRFTIDTSNLPSGTYFVKVNQQTKKLVIVR